MNVLVGKNVFENEIAECSHLSCTFLQFSLVSENLLRMRDLIFQTETVWLVNSNFPLIGTNFSLYFVACLMERCESTFCFFFFKYFFLPLLPNSFSSTCTATCMFGFELPCILFSFSPPIPDKVSFLSHLVSWRLQMKGQGWILTILDKISEYFYSCKRSWLETKMVVENAIQSLLIKLFLFRVVTAVVKP